MIIVLHIISYSPHRALLISERCFNSALKSALAASLSPSACTLTRSTARLQLLGRSIVAGRRGVSAVWNRLDVVSVLVLETVAQAAVSAGDALEHAGRRADDRHADVQCAHYQIEHLHIYVQRNVGIRPRRYA